MPREKGSIKTGGRQKGTPNKKSQNIVSILEDEGLNVARELACIYHLSNDSYEKIHILFKLLEYCYPKRKAVENLPDESLIGEKDSSKSDLSCLSKDELRTLLSLRQKLDNHMATKDSGMLEIAN